MTRLINAFTVDVEDYFQVSAFEHCIDRSSWDQQTLRVERNVNSLLALLDERRVTATFFTLGWIAERCPAMVRQIAEQGHEVASHGYGHQRASHQSIEEFRQDVFRARNLLQDISGQRVIGYRAPSFSIDHSNPWAHQVLNDVGYQYSSSVYPIEHDHYGMPDAPRFPFHTSSGVIEVPPTTVSVFNRNYPMGGGGFFRFLPYAISHWGITRVNQFDREPAVFYCHPWELDPGQPRIKSAPYKSQFRHYVNLAQTEARLARLLKDFSWGRMDMVFAEQLIAEQQQLALA